MKSRQMRKESARVSGMRFMPRYAGKNMTAKVDGNGVVYPAYADGVRCVYPWASKSKGPAWYRADRARRGLVAGR
mgnify:FL=1